MISIKEMVNKLENIRIIGNIEVQIDGLNLCNRVSEKASVLSFVVNDTYVENLRNAPHITALIVPEFYIPEYANIIQERNGCLIVSKQPEFDFYLLHEYLFRTTDFYEKYEYPAKIGEHCCIHPSAEIDDGVIIGNRVTIGAGTVVKRGTIIDDDTVIGCNSVIGSEGFQVIPVPGKSPLHVSHVGKCHICENVFIGDNTCICNSLFEGETYVAAGAKIDNLVYVAHNLYIGENAVLTAHVALCGSSRIEEDAWIGPNSSVLNRVTVGKGAKVGLGSVVTRDVAPHSLVYGSPAKPH